MLLGKDIETRWAVSDGPLTARTKGASATAVCRSVSVEAKVADGVASVSAKDAVKLMPSVGRYEIVWECGMESFCTPVERVGQRYCSPGDIVRYGCKNNDGFEDASRYPPEEIEAAIQQAEEAIEDCAKRSFCERSIRVRLAAGLNELPVLDAEEIDFGSLVSDRQAVVPSPGTANVLYGARPDARLREATVRLAASALRPRLGAENARGQSVDGVYTSYTLATGAEGAWTGIPYVDAVIEGRRSHRVVVA